MSQGSLRSQVERIKYLALAHARLTQFERDVMEAERLTAGPFQRGRAILEQARARLAEEE
jgi:hypothetical protein